MIELITLLSKKTEDGFNYQIKVQRPDGVTVTILIPVEGQEHYDNCLRDHKGSPFGLNFVTDEHYV